MRTDTLYNYIIEFATKVGKKFKSIESEISTLGSQVIGIGVINQIPNQSTPPSSFISTVLDSLPFLALNRNTNLLYLWNPGISNWIDITQSILSNNLELSGSWEVNSKLNNHSQLGSLLDNILYPKLNTLTTSFVPNILETKAFGSGVSAEKGDYSGSGIPYRLNGDGSGLYLLNTQIVDEFSSVNGYSMDILKKGYILNNFIITYSDDKYIDIGYRGMTSNVSSSSISQSQSNVNQFLSGRATFDKSNRKVKLSLYSTNSIKEYQFNIPSSLNNCKAFSVSIGLYNTVDSSIKSSLFCSILGYSNSAFSNDKYVGKYLISIVDSTYRIVYPVSSSISSSNLVNHYSLSMMTNQSNYATYGFTSQYSGYSTNNSFITVTDDKLIQDYITTQSDNIQLL